MTQQTTTAPKVTVEGGYVWMATDSRRNCIGRIERTDKPGVKQWKGVRTFSPKNLGENVAWGSRREVILFLLDGHAATA